MDGRSVSFKTLETCSLGRKSNIKWRQRISVTEEAIIYCKSLKREERKFLKGLHTLGINVFIDNMNWKIFFNQTKRKHSESNLELLHNITINIMC